MALARAEERIEQLRRDCEAVIGECMEAVSGELAFFTLPNCFELFGFDLLVALTFTPLIISFECTEITGIKFQSLASF